MKPKIGSKIHVWWECGEDNMATVLAVFPYTGLYQNFFNCVLRLSCPETKRGWLEMAYKFHT